MGVLQLDNQQKGLKFDGVNDYVITDSTINLATQTGSFAFFIKFNSTGNQTILVNNTGSGGNGYFIYIFSNQLWVQRGRGAGSGDSIWNISINTSSIYHFAVVYKSDLTMDFYLNGVLQTRTSNRVSGSIISSGLLRIGFNNIGVLTFLNAIMYDLKMFNIALNSTEVSQLYNKTSIPSNCVADYRFNQQSGTVLTDYIGGSNGTLTNYTTPETTIGSSNKWLYDFSPYPFDNSRKNGVLLINNN